MDLGHYSFITGDLNLYSFHSTDREHVSTIIHERAHRLISDRSNNTSFFQILTAIKKVTTDPNHKELIKHIILSFHNKTKIPHESIATWAAVFYSNYLQKASPGKIDIPLAYLKYYDKIERVRKFTPAPIDEKNANSILYGVINIGILSLYTTIFSDMASSKTFDKKAVDYYLSIPENNPECRLDLILSYIQSNELPFTYFHTNCNHAVDEIRKNLFQIPNKLDLKAYRNSFIVENAGPKANEIIEELIIHSEKIAKRKKNKDSKVKSIIRKFSFFQRKPKSLNHHSSLVLARRNIDDFQVTPQELIARIKNRNHSKLISYLEIRPTLRTNANGICVVDHNDLLLTLGAEQKNDTFTTKIQATLLKDFVESVDSPGLITLISSYLYFFDNEGFTNKNIIISANRHFQFIVVPTSNMAIFNKLWELRQQNKKKYVLLVIDQPFKKEYQKIQFLVFMNSTVKPRNAKGIVIVPVDSKSKELNNIPFGNRYSGLIVNNLKVGDEYLNGLKVVCDSVSLYLSIMGWVTENDLNPAYRNILPNTELNIPASTDKSYRARAS